MPFRIFITGSGLAEVAQQRLRQENCVFEQGDPADTPEDLARKLQAFNPDGLIVRQGKITEAVQAAAPNLKVICKHGVGTDGIDIDAATRRGIPVLYTPGTNAEATAEHTLALMLALLRQIPLQDRRIRSGIFDKKQYGGLELAGKTLGLIGFGAVGRRVAELVAPFKMQVLVYHPSCTDEPLPAYIRKLKSVAELLPQVDILSLHCHLTPETRNLVNRDSIARMRPGVFIINTARGALVHEGDLLDALQNDRVAGAALDVFADEPPPMDHPLFENDRVIVTAHVGGMSDNSFKNMSLAAMENVLAVLKGEPVERGSLKNFVPGVRIKP